MNQILMILLISVLVLVHEAGHFVAARLCNVRVTRFGFGMPIGPSLKLFRWNKTDFYLHAFLFGGYVSFADDEESQKEALKDNKENEKINDDEVLPKDSPELYENKTILQKLFIVSAGVIMNVVFAVFLVVLTASIFHKLPTSNQILYFDTFSTTVSSNIKEKDIQKNDIIYKINDTKIENFYQLQFFSKYSKLYDDYADLSLYQKNIEKLQKLNPKIRDIDALIEKDEVVRLPQFEAEDYLKVNKNVLLGLQKYKKSGEKLSENQIVLRNKLYKKAEFTVEEEISLNDIAYALSDTYKKMDIVVLRDNKPVELENIIIDEHGLLGILVKMEDIYTPTRTISEIASGSFKYIYTTTKAMIFGLYQLFTGKISASDMHGVIAVVKVGGDIIASKGILNGLLLTAMISINLAIMNFLPIPALDGGHVMFLIIEKVTGKKPDRELSEKITNFFFILLIILMIAICYNDIFALITKKF